MLLIIGLISKKLHIGISPLKLNAFFAPQVGTTESTFRTFMTQKMESFNWQNCYKAVTP